MKSAIVHALAGIVGERQRQIITGVVDEIMVDSGESVGLQLMPVKNEPHAILLHEKVSGFGGMTGERALGEEGKPISGGSRKTKYFQPGAYQEFERFSERDILGLRKLGSMGDRGVTGLTSGELDELQRAGMKLKKRIDNRLSKLAWDALFTGKFNYQGEDFDFEVPSGNALTAATDWSDAAAGKPFSDLWALMVSNVVLMKYKIKEFIINPKTAADIQKTAQALDVLKNYNIVNNDINVVAQFLYPGLPPIKIVKDAYQDETLSSGIVVLGSTTYFVPNDKVLVVQDFSRSMYPQFGDMAITENMNDPSATVAQAAQGIYTFVDEEGLAKRKNPHVDVVAGFNGGPNLKRSDDVVVISV